MARNKYPEETVKRILDISLKLFLEQGYEHTSIQNIIDNLGGLSKGAIYHHFKSKEDILLAVVDQLYKDYDSKLLNIIRDEKEISGLEKLRKLFRASINSSTENDAFQAAPDVLSNPKILALQMQGIIKETVPHYVKPIIEQGIADGSIKTDYPQELAEVISLLLNIWLNPMIFYAEPEGILHRFQIFQQLLKGVGLDINLLDDQMEERIFELCRVYSEKKS
jgi:AcrR family transcriptional regulator